MLPAQQTPILGVTLSCLSDERRDELLERCQSFQQQMVQRGVDAQLALDAAEILTYRPLPWKPREQALVRRAWTQLIAKLAEVPCPPKQS